MSTIQVRDRVADGAAQGTRRRLGRVGRERPIDRSRTVCAVRGAALRAEPDTHRSYRFGLVLVMAMMVLLPLIYVGLIGLIAYGVWFHATNNTGILTATHGSRGGKGALLVYCTPIVAGVTAILFMIKPLFAPRPKEGPRYSLDPATEPRLFQFVATVVSHRPRRYRGESTWIPRSTPPRASGAAS